MNKSCTNCIHYEVCKIRHFPSMFSLTGDGCHHFKPKSCFIELPCEVGDKIYHVGNDGIKEFKVHAIESVVLKNNYKSTYLQFTELNGKGNFDYQIPVERLEDDFFLTKEEAEQALKGGAE